MKARRFLNVVTERCRDGWALSRIFNPRKHLFYPSTAQAQEKEGTSEEDYDGVLRLPAPSLRFKPASSLPGYYDMTSFDFLPFYHGTGEGGSEERILGVGGNGEAVLYDTDTGSAEIMPTLDESKGYFPVSLCANTAADPTRPDALYIMDRQDSSFEALVYGDPNPSPPCKFTDLMDRDRCVWHWRQLPPPPILVDDGGSNYAESYALLHGHGHGGDKDAFSSSSTTTTICVSFSIRPPSGSTYCFDRSTGQWTKAGDWTLPFWSRALHVPELGDDLLFGFQKLGLFRHSLRFSVVDVSGIMRMDGSAPTLRHAWVDIDPPSRWHQEDYSMVYLGDGRLCIHRSFGIMETDGWGSGEESVDTVLKQC